MSEQFKPTHEHQSEKTPSHERVERHSGAQIEKELTSAEKQHGNEKHVEQLSRHVEQKAISGKEHSTGESESTHNHHPVLVNAQLKDMAFSRAMTRTRKQLSPVSRTFSKVVHNKVVDRVSETVGSTIARPTSMLWGAVFAFIGTSALLWITRYYGYEYNYLVAILLFIFGAIAGLAAEGIIRLIKSSKEN